MDCDRDRTLRLMHEMQLVGRAHARFRPVGTDSEHLFGYHLHLLKQQGRPEHRDQIRVADTTYLLSDEGWCYLATVMDLYSRRIVGWAMAPAMPAALVCPALQMAITLRQPAPGLIVHSDRGSQYASHAHTERLARHGAHASMSRKAKAGTTPSWNASS